MRDTRPIEQLKEWEKNPRYITKAGFDRLKYQILKLGIYKPFLVTEEGVILGGNMRIKAYREIGSMFPAALQKRMAEIRKKEVTIEEAEALIADLKNPWVSVVRPKNESEMYEYALSDNDRAGRYDDDMLANEAPNLDLDWGQFSIDLDEPATLEDILARHSDKEEDEAPEVAKGEAISKLGEVYTLGRHRLMCGDSTDAGSVAILMNGQRADMILTDPPYGIAYEESKNWAKPSYVKRPIIGDDKPFDYTTTAWPKCDVWCIWGANYFCNTIPRFYDGNFIVWAKAHSDIENETFGSSFELAWMYPSHKQMIWYVRRINMGKEEHGLHVTQKPIEVCIRAMKYHSLPENKIVVDLFGGSGSTLIACEQTNRTCYMMELDPKYVDVIRKRYATFIEKEAEWQTVSPKIA